MFFKQLIQALFQVFAITVVFYRYEKTKRKLDFHHKTNDKFLSAEMVSLWRRVIRHDGLQDPSADETDSHHNLSQQENEGVLSTDERKPLGLQNTILYMRNNTS